jgi:hypothetical protein
VEHSGRCRVRRCLAAPRPPRRHFLLHHHLTPPADLLGRRVGPDKRSRWQARRARVWPNLHGGAAAAATRPNTCGHPVRSPACAAVCRPDGLRALSNLHGGAVVLAVRLCGRTCGDKVGYVQSQSWSAMPAPWLALWPHQLAPCRRGRRCHFQSEA